MNHTEYNRYYGIDISKTAINMCKNIISKQVRNDKKIILERKDFFDLTDGKCFDAIVAGEVLEHVEAPGLFLKKMYSIANEHTFIYVTTAINCPQKDHIYLFRSVEEVESLINSTGFKIIDRLYIPTNGYSIEKAIKNKAAINVAFILRKI